jgi:WD40 repeat protein
MSEPSVDRDPFEVIAESFLARFRAGERPSVAEYVGRHPELADQIRDLMPSLVMIEQDLSIEPAQGPKGEQPTLGPSPGHERRLGDYRILREIARGGMGVVYEAVQVSLGRRVALKVLPRHVAGDSDALERFRREAKAAARLHHTNIVPVFEVGRDGEAAYYAMQFIEGQGLDLVIDELARLRDPERKPPGAKGSGPTANAAAPIPRGPALSRIAESLVTGRFATGGALPSHDIEPTAETDPFAARRAALDATSGRAPTCDGNDRGDTDRGTSDSAVLPGGSPISMALLSGRRLPFFRSAARIGRQAAQGLAYAHASGIVHRDIKPSNVLLDRAGIVWITDFGLAKGDDEGLTHSGDILGTYRYLAPERFRGEGDARADIYALGLTLYELLTLQPAFDSPDRLNLIDLIRTEEPPKPRSIDARIPLDLETIVLKAIDKDPEARYQSAEVMAEDLRRFLDNEPIQARQVGAAERCWRLARRNPAIALLCGVLTIVLMLATMISILAAGWFARLADDQKTVASKERSARLEAEHARKEASAREASERWERYRSNIAEASAARQLQNSSAGERALEAAPEEYRNWEWRHFHSLLDGASFVLRVPGIHTYTLRLSPDARQIAVGSSRGEIHLFDAATGRPGTVLRGEAGVVHTLEYSPDGRQLASGASDGTIRIWDPATARQHFVLRGEGPPHPLYLRYSSDGKRIATSELSTEAENHKYRLWDAMTGQQLAFLGEGRNLDEFNLAVAFRPDGKRVVAAAGETIRTYDTDTGRLLSVAAIDGGPVNRILFSPDGRRLVLNQSRGTAPVQLRDGETGELVAVLGDQKSLGIAIAFSAHGSRLAMSGSYPDNVVRLWDLGTGKLIRSMSGHTNYVDNLAFSPDGERLASASMDETGRLWDGRTGQEIAVLRGHVGPINGHATFSPNGTRLVTASDDRTLRLWDASSGDLITVLRGHHDRVGPPMFTHDGARLISPSADGTVRIWDMKLAERNGVLRGHRSFVYDVAFHPDGEEVASVAWDGTARLWDPTSGRQTGLLQYKSRIKSAVADSNDPHIMTAVTYSPDGARLATADRALGVALWKTASAEIERIWSGSTGAWNLDGRIDFSRDGRLMAAASQAGPVRLWDLTTGEKVAELGGHQGGSGDVAFAPDGATLASTGLDGTIRLWDAATGQARAVLYGHHTANVNRVAYSPDGGLIASGSDDSTVRLWDNPSHAILSTVNVGSKVYGVAFSPDGTRLALGCADNTVRLIDVATRQEVAALRGHTDYVHAVAWSPDGTRLVSGSGDHTVRVWDSLSVQDRSRRAADKSTPR